ncbi:MAG: DUF4235 domain-containing protein [Gemmatimonadota bacterium]
MTDLERKIAWMAISTGAAVVGHQLARRSLDGAWQATFGTEPPNEGRLDDDLKPALLWAAASGTLVAVARILARRAAESGWKRATGSKPPAS